VDGVPSRRFADLQGCGEALRGTTRVKCAKFCGMGHSKMKGEIVVAP
jgi:hypothetical protein